MATPKFDFNAVTGTGTKSDPLKYQGKIYTGTVQWATGPAKYVNGVKLVSRGDTSMVPDGGAEVSTTPIDEPVVVTPPSATGNPADAEKAALAAGKAFGFLKEFLTAYPNDTKLQEAWLLLLDKDITGAELAFKASDYYKNTVLNSDTRIKNKLSRLGVYNQQLAQWMDEQILRLTGKGIKGLDKSNKAVFDLLEAAYLANDSDYQIDIKALAFGQGKVLGGTTGGSIANLRAYAKAFGMKYTDNDFVRWSQDIFSGKTTTSDIEAQIRQDAASAFPFYADKILDGTSLDALGSGYRSSYATILELDADTIGWDDPTLRRAMQYTTDGKPANMPLWQFERELRKDSRWQYTDNARKSVYDAVYSIGTEWGLL